jgi:hypothetical protein
MRYHWGLGVGHLHAHCPVSTSNSRNSIPDEPIDIEDDDRELDNIYEHASDIDDSRSDSDNSDWDLDNHDVEGREDEGTDSGNDVDCRSELDSESDLVQYDGGMYIQNTSWYKH